MISSISHAGSNIRVYGRIISFSEDQFHIQTDTKKIYMDKSRFPKHLVINQQEIIGKKILLPLSLKESFEKKLLLVFR